MRIPLLVPSQSCYARQLPQRGSQGDTLSNTNLHTTKDWNDQHGKNIPFRPHPSPG